MTLELGTLTVQTAATVHSKVKTEEARNVLMATASEPRKIQRVRLDLIDSFDDARPLDEKHVGELADSIREHGMLQPVVVIQDGDRFRIPIGNHRKAAHELLGLKHIEAEVWPEGTDAKTVRIKSLHENHVRRNEGVGATLDRVDGVMKDHDCDLSEAIRMAKIQGGTASKIKTVYERLCADAKALIQNNKNAGISVAYEVAKGASDPDTQVLWLTEHLAGRMPREAITEAAKAPNERSSKQRSLNSSSAKVTVTVRYSDDATYEDIQAGVVGAGRKIQIQNRRGTPVDLLHRFIG